MVFIQPLVDLIASFPVPAGSFTRIYTEKRFDSFAVNVSSFQGNMYLWYFTRAEDRFRTSTTGCIETSTERLYTYMYDV